MDDDLTFSILETNTIKTHKLDYTNTFHEINNNSINKYNFFDKWNEKYKERKKLVNEENIATYFEFFSIFFKFPLIPKIKKAPTRGIKIIAERIGKFI